MEKTQLVELNNTLLNAKKNINYYKNIIKTDSNDMVLNFLELPIVNKTTMKHSITDFVSDNIKCNELEKALCLKKDYSREYTYNLNNITVIGEYTSGTRGIPFLSLKTLGERIKMGSNMWKVRNKFSKVCPRMMFNFIHNYGCDMNPFPFPRTDNPKMIKKEIEFLSKSDYSWWHITSSKLCKYMNYLRENPTEFKNLSVIENTGAYMSDEEKYIFSKFFNCRIADNYGCRELWMVAYSNSKGYLQINDESIYFELVDDYGNVIHEPYVEGNVVLTSLKQKIMPFIRYSVGDRAMYINSVDDKDTYIKINPNRSKIIGTELYGNKLFKNVVLQLPLKHGISEFSEITVDQKEKDIFIVNIQGYKGDRERIENAFRISAEYILGKANYKYCFTYDENKNRKSIFTVMQ